MATTSPVLTYTRGTQYVQNVAGGQTAHGLVGTLQVGGYAFDTIERMDGYVALTGGRDYPNSSMYHHKRLGYVVNPWHDKMVKSKQDPSKLVKAEILMHRAEVPSDLLGCIGPGFLEGEKLTYAKESMSLIWQSCGGQADVTTGLIVVTLRVVGSMQKLESCTRYTG